MRTEDRGDIEHGTFVAYNHYRCRCTQCRAFRAWHARQYRARLRKAALAAATTVTSSSTKGRRVKEYEFEVWESRRVTIHTDLGPTAAAVMADGGAGDTVPHTTSRITSEVSAGATPDLNAIAGALAHLTQTRRRITGG